MIIRISGGASGIKEYLEGGQKQDRFYSRDELDSRIILDGDLSITDTIINSMNKHSNKYFHITLAFKEDHISQDMLQNINNEFKEYFLAGYTDEEINYYAEAHLPKIKSYRSNADPDTLIERKPHIHIVVPKINLANSTSFNPSIKHCTKYINAFQEYINDKYGLESPKDNLRVNFNNSSGVISRHKGDIFGTKNKEQKSAILNLAVEQNPSSINELKDLLISNGYQVKVRNENNTQSSYLNIKLDANTKGINLKEFIFKNDFLSLTKEEKLKQLEPTNKISYMQSSNPKASNLANTKLIEEWQTTKSLELKFINRNSSKNERIKYKQLSMQDKITYLNQKQTNYQQHYQLLPENNNQNNSDQLVTNKVENNIYTATTINNLVLDNIHNKSNFDTSKLHMKSTNQDSIVGELLSQSDEQKNQQDFKNQLKKLNELLHANVLLELVSKTHGINPGLYHVTTSKSGADRIKCGNRNLSVVDFCLKELNLSFKESVNILNTAYNMQCESTREQGWNIHNKIYLKHKYQEWLVDYKASKLKSFTQISDYTKAQRKSIITDTKDKIQLIRKNTTITPTQKTKQINLLKAQQTFNFHALTTAKQKEFNHIRKQFNLSMQSSYRTFLAEQAQLGDNIALHELRRLRIRYSKQQPNHNSILYVNNYQEFRLNISYDIDETGTICYKLNNHTIIRDTGKKLEVVQDTTNNIKLSLDLAINKFGRAIQLTGTEEFKRQVVDLAIKHNHKVEFIDTYSKQYYIEKLEQNKLNANSFHKTLEKLINNNPDKDINDITY